MLLIYRYLTNIFFPLIIIIIYLRTQIKKEDKTDNQSVLVNNVSPEKWSKAKAELGKTVIQINDIFDNLSISSIKLDEFNTKLVNVQR